MKTDATQLTALQELKAMAHKKRHFSAGDAVVYLIMVLYAIFLMFPFVVLLITSFSSEEHLVSHIGFAVPSLSNLTVQNYVNVLKSDEARYIMESGGSISVLILGFLNTLWQVVPTTLVGIFVSGMAAYAYAKLEFPFKKVLFGATLAIIVLPLSTLTIPSYLYYYQLGWTETALPIIIPGMFGNAVLIFYLTQSFKKVPNEVFEAAKIDGLGTFGIYRKIILPLSVPALVAQGILSFVGGYNNFLGALLYLESTPELYPLQMALYKLQGYIIDSSGVGAGQMCASVVIAMLPLIIIYVIFRNQFREGLTDGAVKG